MATSGDHRRGSDAACTRPKSTRSATNADSAIAGPPESDPSRVDATGRTCPGARATKQHAINERYALVNFRRRKDGRCSLKLETRSEGARSDRENLRALGRRRAERAAIRLGAGMGFDRS